MNRALRKLAACAALILSAATAPAALQLRISDGTPAGTILISDQDVLDTNPDVGVVFYSGPVGSQWIVNVSSGTSKPILGSAAYPDIDLNSFSLSSASGGSLTVELTDTGFTGNGPATLTIGGVTAGSLTVKAFVDAGNMEFGQAMQVVNGGPFTGGSFGVNLPTAINSATPYSITTMVTVNHPTGGSTGFDAEFALNPPPLRCAPDTTIRCGDPLDPYLNEGLGIPSYTPAAGCDDPVIFSYSDVVSAGICPQVITRTWTVTDGCFNTNTCVQRITVIDETAPTLMVPPDTSAECSAVPPVGTATASDDCDPNPTVTYLGETRVDGPNPACGYSLIRTWKASDVCGHAVTNSQTIMVVDTTKPVLTVPADVTAECDRVPAVGSASATDLCDTNVTVRYLGETRENGNCAGNYKLIRTWEASDDCGNAIQKSQTIMVQDTTKPTLTVPANMTVECSVVPGVGNATATDLCDAAPVVTYLGATTNAAGCGYTITRTWQAVDACGNAETKSQILTVRDVTAPMLTVPGPISIECGAAIPAPGNATATDNCDSAPVVTYLGQMTNGSGCSYTITRRWKATDSCGNAATNSQIITVRDTVAPVISSVPAGGEIGCTALPTDASIRSQVTATDACGTVTINVTHVDSATACATNRTFTITATDGCNTSAPRTVTYTASCGGTTQVCSTFNFNGNTALYGTAGNIRTYTTNGVSVKVSAFSRVKGVGGAWASAYVGAYPGGLGVTDGSEGSGGGNSHTVDNIDRDNYLLFEFSAPVVINRAFLGYVVSDSDLNLWVGSFANPFANHMTLSDSVLGTFGFTEENITDLTTTRWADVNAGEVSGNAIVISAWTGDTTPEDQFKLQLLEFCTRSGSCVTNPPATGSICGSVLRDCDANSSLSGEAGLSGWTVTLKMGATVIATKTTDASGNYCFNNLAAGDYCVVITPMASYSQTVDPDATKDHKGCLTLAAGQNKTGVNFGYTGTAPGVNIVMTGPASARCGDTITYTICVTNTGNTCLYGGMVVNDPLLGGQIFHQTPVNPGQGFCFTKTYVVKTTDAGTLVNTATVIGDPPGSLANVTKTVSVSTAVTCTPTSQGCTLTIGYYKNHPTAITPLPIHLGTAGGAKTLVVSSQQIGVDVLRQCVYGASANGITKLYAQLLAAKLNGLRGATLSAVSATISAADAFLATHNHQDWGTLTTAEKNSVLAWHLALDRYNNGLTGPGHCGDTECARPIKLTATCGSSFVKLSWDRSPDATCYKVGRALTPSGPYTIINNNVTGTNYTDTAVVNGTAYFYLVTACRNGVETTDSDEVCAIPRKALASPWRNADIGSPSLNGGSSCVSGKYTILGSGDDIWNTSDEHQFAYQAASGNCSIVARVTGIGNTHDWAKAGVMIRETLTGGSKHAFMCLTPANGAAFQCRTTTGGSSINANTTGHTAPKWVKLVRAGNVFTGYVSSNGTTWTKIGEQTITMGTSVYIGMGVTSHNDGVLSTATFENVIATP